MRGVVSRDIVAEQLRTEPHDGVAAKKLTSSRNSSWGTLALGKTRKYIYFPITLPILDVANAKAYSSHCAPPSLTRWWFSQLTFLAPETTS